METSNDSRDLKSLQTQLRIAEENLSRINSEIERMNQLRRELLDTLDSCRKKIGKFRSMDKDIVVSEHAILRFLERVEKLDIEKIKESILPPITKDLISKMSKANGSYPSMTHQLVLRDNIIVTVKEL